MKLFYRNRFELLLALLLLACNFTFSQDTDSDGIVDSIDIDDDNDGIIDIYECSAIIQFNNAAPLTASSLNDVQPGEKVIYSNAVVYGSQYYDIVLTIIAKNGSFTVDCNNELRIDSFDASADEYVTYSFDLVQSGSATVGDPDGIPATLYDITLESRDIDTRNNKDFTEISGINTTTVTSSVTTYLSATTNLEQAGFANGPDPAGFTLFRLDPTIVAPNTDWMNEPDDGGTQGDDPDFYLYMEFDQFSHVDLLFGSTGTDTNTSIRLTNFGISSSCDTDKDGVLNTLEIDSDNDGIPDNIEAQSTAGYIAPTGSVGANGVLLVYGAGITPIDSDNDLIFDMFDLDTDNDGIPDIQENGMADAIVTFTDDDTDGLDNIFETNGTNDATFDVNEDIENPSDLSILPDTDGDLAIGGDLDYRDGLDVFFSNATIDFDGVDDYVDSELDMSGMTKATVMTWIKLDPAFSNTGVIINQGNFLLDVDGSKILSTNVNSGLNSTDASNALLLNKWYHIAVIFDSALASDNLKLYLNGKLLKSISHPSLNGPIGTSSDKFTIGKSSNTNNDYFKGAIDEVRVFNTALTEGQLHQMIHQEIDNNSGVVKGKIVPKNITDFNTSATIPWSALEVYYPMTDITSSKTSDYSDNNLTATLHNIRTMQAQTAPMPYTTKADGDWELANKWTNGDVWNMAAKPETNPWSIIKVSHNMVAKNDINSHAIIIDANKSITVADDKVINNLWYLEINGTIDLQGDSQLIQGRESDLVTSADGKILRRQEGNANYYRYNYWSSPVGTQGVTTISDNNGAANNPNNTPFNLNMLKDGNGSKIQFTNALEEPGKVSTQWLYTFQNGVTYYGWSALNQNSAIQPGYGYTQKGLNGSENEQQYIFEGKPNNGTILIAADDVDGDSANESEKDVTLTTTLIGNPYPSALDAVQFINDNKPGTGNGTISGTILLWEQWAGSSHYLAEYEGGYGYINTLTTERAYQHADIPIVDQVITQGIKVPTFQIPIGQGFFVEVINDGDIEFNNGQRVFAKESDADGSSTNGSAFFRSSNSESTTSTESAAAETQILRLEFGVSSGASRSFVLGFSEDATDGYDYGLDGGLILDPPADDMGSLLEGQQYVIQAFAPYTQDKEIDLVLHASGSYTYTLKSTEISNFPVDQDLFIKDVLTGQDYNLRSTEPYNFTSLVGSFTDRFKVIFQDPATLSTEDITNDNILIYVKQPEEKLYVSQLTEQVKKLSITNLLGQPIISFDQIDNQTLENGLDISFLNTGIYIFSITFENNQTIDKKLIVQ